MRRRSMLTRPLAAALVLLSSGGARAIGADAAVLLVPDARAVMLRRFVPAAGPLARMVSRPGAWYALLYLPMAAARPMQLQLWPFHADQELGLLALDAAPNEAPGIAHRVPVEVGGDGPDARSRISRFMLPAASQAPGVFMLIELWRADGERPMPLWLQLRTQPMPRPGGTPWWASRPTPPEPAPAPLGPLARQAQTTRSGRAHELPILALQSARDGEGWR